MQRCFSLTVAEQTKIQAYADDAKISFSRAVRLLAQVGLAYWSASERKAKKEAS